MADKSGVQLIGAAVVALGFIVGGAIVASALNGVSGEIEQTRASLKEIKAEIATAQGALKNVARAPAARQPQKRRGPDPDKRYEIDVKGSPALGPETAKIKIVEFSDFQCPFCKRVGPTLTQIKQTYGDDVQIVWKNMPLSFHAKAPGAHKAAMAAHNQGKFWEMHDKIFADQRTLTDEQYLLYAQELGLDVDQFKTDVADPATQQALDADLKTAASVGVSGTPAFFVNGRYLSGAQPFESFKGIIDEELNKPS
jgi:protein-disulfide isomerase